jgi:LEA14-like dessication related protein
VSARRYRPWIALSLACTGCAALIQAPGVEVESVHVESVTLTGGTMTLELRLTNPNNYELSGTAVDYALRVGDASAAEPRWVDVASGVREQGFTLPPLGEATVAVPMRFDWVGVGTAVRQLIERKRLAYQAEGAVRVELPGGVRRIPFRHQGKVES